MLTYEIRNVKTGETKHLGLPRHRHERSGGRGGRGGEGAEGPVHILNDQIGTITLLAAPPTIRKNLPNVKNIIIYYAVNLIIFFSETTKENDNEGREWPHTRLLLLTTECF